MTTLREHIEGVLKAHEEHSPIYTCRFQILDEILSAVEFHVDDLIPAKKKLTHGVDMVTIKHYNDAIDDIRAKLQELTTPKESGPKDPS